MESSGTYSDGLGDMELSEAQRRVVATSFADMFSDIYPHASPELIQQAVEVAQPYRSKVAETGVIDKDEIAQLSQELLRLLAS